MKIFCETIFKDTLPALRSIITSELIKTYGLTQEQVAEKLSITQPAVSQYLNGLRGKHVQELMADKKLIEWLKKLVAEIATGNVKFGEIFCDICKRLREESL